MRRDPSIQSNIDRIDRRKQNRARRVKTEPTNAEPGDMVLMGNDVLIFDDNKWINYTKPLRDRITALEKKLEDMS